MTIQGPGIYTYIFCVAAGVTTQEVVEDERARRSPTGEEVAKAQEVVDEGVALQTLGRRVGVGLGRPDLLDEAVPGADGAHGGAVIGAVVAEWWRRKQWVFVWEEIQIFGG